LTKHANIRLDSAELSGLWANYLADSMAKCMLGTFLRYCDDSDIKNLLKKAISLSNDHLTFISDLFKNEDISLPIGFSDEDANPDAPRLFNDVFYLYYLENMGAMGLTTYGNFLSGASRADICEYASKALSATMDLYNNTNTLLREKGLEIRAPFIAYPDKSGGYVDDTHFLAGWWGERRPLTASEIANLFINLHSCETNRALLMAFAQTTNTNEVRDFMKRGKAICEKHMEIYSGFLKESDLPAPASWDNEVGRSTTWTYSDRLMMFQIALLGERAISDFGVSVSLSHRRDLATSFIRLSAEMVKLMTEGAKIMIKNHWMEKPPMAVDRTTEVG
jgi:hypothetical protein